MRPFLHLSDFFCLTAFENSAKKCACTSERVPVVPLCFGAFCSQRSSPLRRNSYGRSASTITAGLWVPVEEPTPASYRKMERLTRCREVPIVPRFLKGRTMITTSRAFIRPSSPASPPGRNMAITRQSVWFRSMKRLPSARSPLPTMICAITSTFQAP